MPAVPYLIEITRADVGQRSHAFAAREALRAVAKTHLFQTLGKHFKQGPETMPGGAYGYAPRAEGYQERKKRTKGHKDPLVFSGEFRNRNRNQGLSAITATQHVATIRLFSPHPMNAQQWDEVKAIAPQELVAYQQLAMQTYAEVLQARGARKSSKRIGSFGPR